MEKLLWITCFLISLIPLSFGIYFGVGVSQMIKHRGRWETEFQVIRKQLNGKIALHLSISAFLIFTSVIMCLAVFKRW